jgi:hypothetical protein
MSDGILKQGNLFPFRQYNESDIINFYALNGTGLNGMFVSFDTGNQAPENADGYSSIGVGASYTNIVSNRYLNNRRVHPAVAGETVWQVAGVTLHTTAEYDENGNKLVLMPDYVRAERGFVYSGQSVPLVRRGIVTLALSQVANAATTPPLPGYLGIITGNGKIAAIAPGDVAVTGAARYDLLSVGRFISSSGANNGGSVQFDVQL